MDPDAPHPAPTQPHHSTPTHPAPDPEAAYPTPQPQPQPEPDVDLLPPPATPAALPTSPSAPDAPLHQLPDAPPPPATTNPSMSPSTSGLGLDVHAILGRIDFDSSPSNKLLFSSSHVEPPEAPPETVVVGGGRRPVTRSTTLPDVTPDIDPGIHERVVQSFAAPDRPRVPRALVAQRRRGVSTDIRAQARMVFYSLAVGQTVQDPSGEFDDYEFDELVSEVPLSGPSVQETQKETQARTQTQSEGRAEPMDVDPETSGRDDVLDELESELALRGFTLSVDGEHVLTPRSDDHGSPLLTSSPPQTSSPFHASSPLHTSPGLQEEFVATDTAAAQSSPLPPPAPAPTPPPAQESWMPGGPRRAGLLLSYSTHIARSIYELTSLEEDVESAAAVWQPRRVIPRRQRRRVDETGASVAVEDDLVEEDFEPSVAGTESTGTSTAAPSSTSTAAAAASASDSAGPVTAAASVSKSVGPSTSAATATQSVGPSTSAAHASDIAAPSTTTSAAATATAVRADSDSDTPSTTTESLTGKVLKIHARTPYFAHFEKYRRDDELSWFPVAARSGLTDLRSIGAAYRDDEALVSAFVERWHPETNSFHFWWGELTITLHDVERIMGLAIYGRSCASAAWTDDRVRQRLAEDFEISTKELHAWTTGGGVPCSKMSDQLKKWMEMEDRNEFKCVSYYLFLLLTSTVLVDKTTNKGKHFWLQLLYDHGVTGEYAWGAAVLASLYRNLGQASRQLAKGIAGCPILLTAWIWTYFPHFRQNKVINPAALFDKRVVVRAGGTPATRRGKKSVVHLRQIRRILDDVSFSEVVWQPWGPLDFNDPTLSSSLFRGIIRAGPFAEPYMPDRVLRQFGITQGKPVPSIAPLECTRPAKIKGRPTYKLTFPPDSLAVWDSEHRPLIELRGPETENKWNCTEEYVAYMQEYSHSYVDPRSVLARERQRPPRPHTVETVARNQVMIDMIVDSLAPEDQQMYPRALLQSWLQFLRTGELPEGMPQHIFRDSEHQEGQGSGAAE